MGKSILIVAWLCSFMCLPAAAAFAATNATITLQGRLTDVLSGTPVADGSHPAHIVIERADNGQIVEAFPTIQTKDGYFTVDVSGLPNEIFECNEGAAECTQVVVVSVDGQDPFPDIVMSNGGRSAVTSRVNGDIQTTPSRVDIPASDQFNPQTATFTDGGMNFTDENDQPVFNLDTKITPAHPERTFDVSALTNFNGLTKVNGRFDVGLNGNPDPYLTLNNVDGFRIRQQPVTFDPNGDGLGEFGIDVGGNTRFNCNGDGLPDFELLNNGLCNLHNNGLSCDRNNDGINDINFLSDGTCNFNCDADPANEVVFGQTAVTCRVPVKIDGDGDNVPECFLGDYGGEAYFDPDQDNDSELGVTDNGVRVGGSLTVDLNGAAAGENASVGPTGLEYKSNGALATSSFKVNGTQAIVNVDQVGADELSISKQPGDIRATTTVTGDFKVNVLNTALDDFRITQGFTYFNNTSLFIDPDGDGTTNTSFGNNYNVIGGELHVNTASGGLSVTEAAGLTTVTINGDLNVTGTKNFVQPDPEDPAKEIVYVALEAGEAGTYTRGSSRLHDGVAVIGLPDHFRLVTAVEGLTAQITPRGPAQSMLYVESVDPSHLIVRASNASDSDVPFDYTVNGVRLGFENHQVIRDRTRFASAH